MTRLETIQSRLAQIPAETAELSKQLTGILAEQAELAEELNQHHSNFDLVRITHSKRLLGISLSQIRKYEREGLTVHRRGRRQAFVSKRELADFITKHTIQKAA